jgi:hypothetical protein
LDEALGLERHPVSAVHNPLLPFRAGSRSNRNQPPLVARSAQRHTWFQEPPELSLPVKKTGLLPTEMQLLPTKQGLFPLEWIAGFSVANLP